MQPRSDSRIQDEFDELFELACAGDRRALGAIAIACNRMLLAEARAELGASHPRAGDVVHEFLAAMTEGRVRFVRGRGQGRAIAFIRRVVRAMARRGA
jgi:hypothetical protein